MGDGARHHGVAAPTGSDPVKYDYSLCHWHDECLRLQSPAEGRAVPWWVCQPRALHGGRLAHIRSTVKRSRTRANPPRHPPPERCSSVSSRLIDRAIAWVAGATRNRRPSSTTSGRHRPAWRRSPRAGHRVQERCAEPLGHRAQTNRSKPLTQPRTSVRSRQQHVFSSGTRAPAARAAPQLAFTQNDEARVGTPGRRGARPRSGDGALYAAPAPRRCRRSARAGAARMPRGR